MTTSVEKLVCQIFERKKWIIEQVKQQIYLYEQHLASNLLIEGINPPPWFLNPNSHSLSSDPKELNKEELIADLLLPHARPTFPYSTGQCYLQNRLVVTGDSSELLDTLPKDIQESNKDLVAGDELRPLHESRGNDVVYTANCVLRQSYASSYNEADARVSNFSNKSGQSPVKSQRSQQVVKEDTGKVSDGSLLVVHDSTNGPEGGIELMTMPDRSDMDPGCMLSSVPKCFLAEKTEARVSNNNLAPDQSLAIFQRSRSRQKALEIRTSAKATRSRKSHENKSISYSGVPLYGIDPEEPDHSKDFSLMAKSFNTNKGSSGERVASSSLSIKNGRSNNCGSITISENTCRRPKSGNEHLKLDVSHENVRKDSANESCDMRQAKGIDASMEYCSLNEECSLPSITKSMEQSSQGKCHKSLDPEVSLEKSTSDPYKVSLEKQLMELSEVSKENQKARKSFVSNTEGCSENDTASEPFKNGNQQVNHSEDDLKAALYQSQPPNEKYVSPSDLRKETHDKEVQVSSVASVSIANFAVAHSKSGAAEEYPLASLLNQSNGDTLTNLSGNRSILLVAETDATANQEKKIPSATAIEFEGHPPCLKYNIDNVNSRTDSEGSVVKLPYDVPFVVKPKQLNFDALEYCSLNEECSLPSITKSMEQSSQGKCHKSLDPEVSLEKSTSDPYKVSLEKQLMELSDVLKENQKSRKSFVSNTEGCSENDTASEPFKNGNQQVNHSEDDLKAALYQSQPPNEKYVSPSDLRKETHDKEVQVSSVASVSIANFAVAHSKSGAAEEYPLASLLNQSNGDTLTNLSGNRSILLVAETDATANQEKKILSATAIEFEGHPPCLKYNIDNVNSRTDSEGSVVKLPYDVPFVVKPKQLNFDALEYCSLNEECSLPSITKSMEQSSQGKCHKSLDPEVSLEKSTSDPYKVSLEKQLMELSEVLKENQKARKSFVSNTEGCSENDTASQPFKNGNQQVNHSEDDLKAALYQSQPPNEKCVSPSDLRKGSHVDICQSNCHLTEVYPVQHLDTGHFCSERSSRCDIIPPTLENQCSGSLAIPCLTKLATEDPESLLDKELIMKKQSDDLLDARQCSSVDSENNLLLHKRNISCEKVDNLAGTEKMTSVEGYFNLIEERINICASSGDPQDEDAHISSLKFGETLPTYISSFSKNRSRHTKVDSWPQCKRRKIEYQQTNCFSASPSCRVQKLHNIHGEHISSHSKTIEKELDAFSELPGVTFSHLRNGSESSDMFHGKMECHLTDGTLSMPIIKNQQEEAGYGTEEQSQVIGTPSTSEHGELGPCFISSLCKQATTGSHGSYVEHTTSDPGEEILTAENLSAEQDFQKFFYSCNVDNLEDNDILEQSQVIGTPSTSEHGELGPCFISSLCKQATTGSHGSYVEHTTSDPGEEILTAENLSAEQDFQKFFYSCNVDNLEDNDILTSTQSALLDNNCGLKGELAGSTCNSELAFDQDLPVFEAFVLNEPSDNGGLDPSGDGINFSEINATHTSMNRASVLEHICRTASMCTPLSHFPSAYKPLKNKDLYISAPERLLERPDIASTLSFIEDAGSHPHTSTDEANSSLRGMLYSDSLPYSSSSRYSWSSRNSDTPAAGKYCERISSSSFSSGKRLSSNPELTCFPIEEDPCVDETENADEDDDDDHIQKDIGLADINSCANEEPLFERMEVCPNPPASVSAAEKYHHIGLDCSNTGVQSSVKHRLRNHCSNKKSKNWGKENQVSSVGANSSIKVNESLRFSKAKLSSTTSIKRGAQRLSEKVKRNNIVSNVTSFIPLVQQKQAAAVVKGKRDIKVRALEAAEAAKRLEEQKENERKVKKEALKLERAKIEQETLRQKELDKRKKEEELKKKDADLAARKRLREEEGRKEKERKRKRIEVGLRTQRAAEEKVFAGKGEKEKQCGNRVKNANNRMESNNRARQDRNVDKVSADGSTMKRPESQTEFKTTGYDIQQVSTVPENCETLGDCDGTQTKSMLDQIPSESGVATKTSHEKSYEMSPYQHSDDEEEEEDDLPAKKFTPSWASKYCVGLVLPSQQQIDPSVIFPRESFCSMDEVLLPRHLTSK